MAKDSRKTPEEAQSSSSPTEKPTDKRNSSETLGATEKQLVMRLEQELQSTREDLHSATSELEKSKEELLASKNEVLSSNKNLQGQMGDFQQSHYDLKKQEERLKHLADSLPVLISYIDSELRYRFNNQRFEEWFQKSPEEMKGKLVQEILNKEIYDLCFPHMKAVLQGQPQSFELEISLPDGSQRQVQLEYVPHRNERNEIVGFYSVVHDVTRLLQAEAEAAILKTSEKERRRIGQDLHDTAGQVLTGLSYMAQTLLETLEDSSPAVAVAKKIREGIDKAIQDIRRLIRGLVPVELDEEGFMAALQELTYQVCNQYGLDCSFHNENPVLVEDSETATQLYRIAQEAITNAARHAQGTRIDVYLSKEDQQVILEIQDDGIGIRGSPGMGLKSMRHRAKVIGAKLNIRSEEGNGTRVTCICTQPNKPD